MNLSPLSTREASLCKLVPQSHSLKMYSRLPLVIAALSNVAFAHFILQYPPSLGFDDSIEGTAPCGGFPVVFNSSDANLPVGAFSTSMLSTHPQAQWLFRGTLSKQAPFNWTNLLPVVMETGLGQFCPTGLSAPPEFAGSIRSHSGPAGCCGRPSLSGESRLLEGT